MFICMIVHQGHTPGTSIRMFFFAFTKSIRFTHKFLSFVGDHNVCFEKSANLEEQQHIAGPAIAQTARQLIQINAIPLPHYFHNVEGNT